MLTRRKFIGTTLVAGATLATGAQQTRPQPASKRTIVDAQVHFWKASSPDWPWDPGVTPQLPEPFAGNYLQLVRVAAWLYILKTQANAG